MCDGSWLCHFPCKNIEDWQQSHFFSIFRLENNTSPSGPIYGRALENYLWWFSFRNRFGENITGRQHHVKLWLNRHFIWKMCKMKSFLFLIFLQISRVIMDNLEDLRIIDSLLKDYDRRATPTNRMGRFYCLDWFVDFVTLSIQTPEFWITNLIEPPFVLWRNSLDNFENRTTVLWISLSEPEINKNW